MYTDIVDFFSFSTHTFIQHTKKVYVNSFIFQFIKTRILVTVRIQ